MLALDNISVLDMTHNAPGAYCTMILGDLGAAVLKIEPPPASGARVSGSAVSPSAQGEKRNAAFFALNRNKKSLGLNLKTTEGLEVFMSLAHAVDVIIEGFRPGTVKRLGVDYETVCASNPRIVYCSLSGYGQDGPWRSLPGHDINYIAMAGALGLIGAPHLAPSIPLNLVGDFAGGSSFAVIGILTALLARERTGRGQYVDAAIYDGVISLLTWQSCRFFAEGKVPPRGSTALAGGYPYYGVYCTKDDAYIAVGCLEPWFWENLCRALGKEEYIGCGFQQDHYVDPPKDAKWAEITAVLRAIFLTKTRDEWFDLLSKADVPVSKVNTLAEALSDPQVKRRGMLLELQDAAAGHIRQLGIPIKLSETPGSVRSLSPLLGENTDEVLLDLGYDMAQIRRLRNAGVVA